VTAMTTETRSAEKLLNLIDLSAIADRGDKFRECEFFFGLAVAEVSRERFRWLVSAFLNAAYSFFESSALSACVGISDPQSGDPVKDSGAVEILRKYVEVVQRAKNPYFVKTEGRHPITQRLYKYRIATTHHFPLSIMAGGPSLPEDFEFGSVRGEGVNVLALCREALDLIRKLQEELEP